MIPFNKPYLTGKETHYIYQAVSSGKLSGNGAFTKTCQHFFEETYGFGKCLLTSSCTDALEMAAILCDIQPGDEVIMPSYTFVSTSNAFVLRGATIVFADSRADHPGMDESSLAPLINARTKAIVPVHYAGVACDMDEIMTLAEKHDLFVVEDAAQCIDSYYQHRDGTRSALGSIGHFAAFSFHETKNIISGEGGMLVINDNRYADRAEIIWEKGTNRSAFFRGEVDKYGWVDIGSSFLPSEVTAAFLWAQLEMLKTIQARRIELWQYYHQLIEKENGLKDFFRVATIPDFAMNNAHMFYIVCHAAKIQRYFLTYLKKKGFLAVFHYLSLHRSPYYANKHDGRALPMCDRYSDQLIRLPLFYELSKADIEQIVAALVEGAANYKN